MEIIYLLVPLAVLIAVIIVVVFLWAVKSGQFDDLEGPAHRILMDEAEDAPSLAHGPRLDPIGEAEDAPNPISGRESEASRASDSAHGPIADVQDARMPRRPGMAESGLDPIGEAEDAPSLAHGPRLDPIGDDDRPAESGRPPDNPEAAKKTD